MAEAVANNEVKVEKVEVDSQAMWTLSRLAKSLEGGNGYGKLLGYFDKEKNALTIQHVLPLCPQKADDRSKTDLSEEELKKRCETFMLGYRVVGFYIIADDEDYFTYPIFNSLVNNEKMVHPSTFLYLSPRDLSKGLQAFRFLTLSDSYRKTIQQHHPEKVSGVEVQIKEFREFTTDKNPMFCQAKLSVIENPFSTYLYENYTPSKQEYTPEDSTPISEIFSEHIEDCISQNLNEFVKLIANRKNEKDSNEVNFYGSLQRIKKLLEDKRAKLTEMQGLFKLASAIN